ncbi:MAG: DNA mismatch repair endonuclease MutL, partial [Saprospiraceae bacterium]
ANVDVFFSLHHNGTEIFHLPPGKLRQRIVGIFGKASNPKLVKVKEETDAMTVTGYIGKPEYARKTRGEQLFFVNQRFIKSGYLHHAVMSAYEDLVQKDTYPMYVLFIEMDPARIDINVHPTKQEIKFDDERLVYNYLKVAVRHALGKYSIMPSLDFEQETSFSQNQNFGLSFEVPPQETFEKELSGTSKTGTKENTGTTSFDKEANAGQGAPQRNWQKLFEGLDELEEELDSEASGTEGSITIESNISGAAELDDGQASFAKNQKEPYQIHGTYIISHIKSGFLLIDQQAAHERILYEKYLDVLEKRQAFTQRDLFPKTVNLSPADATLMEEILPHLNLLGFDIQPFGNDAFVIQGIPADLVGGHDELKLIETLLYQYKRNIELSLNISENLARSMARSAAIKRGQPLEVREMQELIDKLFACAMPFKSPSGRNCFLTYEMDILDKDFRDG